MASSVPLRLFYGLHGLADDAADGVGGGALHSLRGVGVGAEGKARVIVPQRAGQCLDIHAVLEGQRGEGVTNAMVRLGGLAEMHSFFRVLYTKWFYFRSVGFENTEAAVSGALDELRSLPEELPLYQKQIQRFFELVLDIDKAGREPSRQVLRYYHFDQPNQPSNPELFPFRLLTTRFEPVDGDACAPVLYANTVADMISFSLQTCVERSITVRRCKNCGRCFAQTGRVSAEYCDRTPLDGQSSCRAMGAFQQWTLKQADDPVFNIYRREYKRRFAWIKAGRISDSEFYAWSEQAREQKKKCDEGIITAEDFQRWLKESRQVEGRQKKEASETGKLLRVEFIEWLKKEEV